MKIAVLMDPISGITIKKDSTFAMLLEIQKRQWPLSYLEPSDLFLENGTVFARCRELAVENNPQQWFEFQNEQVQPLANFDLILMRKDPPFNMEYIYLTYLLELVEKQGTLVVNKPQSLRDANEKLFTAWFPQCCPHTLVSRDCQRLKAFWQTEQDIIVKPLDGMGGQEIFRIQPQDPNLSVILQTLTRHGKRNIMAQRYIPEVVEGDNRILMINGEPIPYALARIPQPGETRANLAAGGTGVPRPLTEKEQWICKEVGPALRNKGLIFVGLDVIGGLLTEINVTSPTCIQEIEAVYPVQIAKQLMDCLENLKP